MTILSTTADGPTDLPLARAAYIHVPFCAHRCGYCDFTLIARRDDLIGDYLRSLDLEIKNSRIPSKTTLDTLFFGGGTPTHLDLVELQKLFQIVDQQFLRSSTTEFSVEANPLDLSDDKIDLLANAGVNRVSLGVQSFSRQSLELLERDHLPEDVSDVVNRLHQRFDNVSLDLIFGIPGQSIAEWRDTLQMAIDLGPAHLSTYGLTFEKGTAFWTRRERGELSSTEEELERAQYDVAMEILSQAGYEQYEISNYAKPGFRCRHNNVYWNGDSYFGFGPGAARYLNGRRETNIRSVLGWLARLERNESPVAETEELDVRHRAKELIYLGLRRNEGLNREIFQQRTGLSLDEITGDAVRQNLDLGLLEDDGSSIRLTREGRFVADRVVMDFL